MNVITPQLESDVLNIQQISQEAIRFGYTTKTVVKFHSTLIEILMSATAHLFDIPTFQLILKFSSTRITCHIITFEDAYSHLTSHSTPLRKSVQILKREDLRASITKMNGCNILKVKLKAKQNTPVKKEHTSKWEIRGGQARKIEPGQGKAEYLAIKGVEL